LRKITAAALAIFGLAVGSFSVMAKMRAATRSILPSTGNKGRSNAIAPMAAAVYGPMPGKASNPA
jgi:hypothetical protein